VMDKKDSFQDTRYDRQEKVPLFGEAGQRNLSSSSVVVTGAGGVKSTLLLTLAAVGIGRIRIIDHDRVELSNLNRQVLYTTADIGRPKAAAAADRLTALNPEIAVEAIVDRVTPDNFAELIGGCDLALEGGESAEARKEFNRSALRHRVIFLHASAQYNYAYIYFVMPGTTPCFECLFSDLPRSHKGAVPVLPTATHMAGAMAASDVLNFLLDKEVSSAGTLVMHDCWLNRQDKVPISFREDCICKSLTTGSTLTTDPLRASRR
jgi:molybdopterin/thiamine biosynthesis adenylyltransferase